MPGFNQMNGAYNEQQGISWSTIAGYTLAGIGIAGGLRMAGRSAGRAIRSAGDAVSEGWRAGGPQSRPLIQSGSQSTKAQRQLGETGVVGQNLSRLREGSMQPLSKSRTGKKVTESRTSWMNQPRLPQKPRAGMEDTARQYSPSTRKGSILRMSGASLAGRAGRTRRILPDRLLPAHERRGRSIGFASGGDDVSGFSPTYEGPTALFMTNPGVARFSPSMPAGRANTSVSPSMGGSGSRSAYGF